MLKATATLLAVPLLAILVLLIMESFHARQCTEPPPKGTLITIPGERMEILSDPGDERLLLDVVRDPFAIPDYQLVPEHGHIHPHQAEGFEVVAGRAQVLVGNEIHTLAVGDQVVVPPDTVHHWMALDGEPVRVEAFFDPPLEVAGWFVHFQAHIASDTMDLLQAAVISREYGDSSPAPVEPSPLIWSVASRVLAPLGRLMGYRAC